tara:strand:- start:11891 stop:12778 length:888 start_codon:yes stop_codon:yes gene_type:complete
MEKDQIFILKDRGVIFINGEDARDFLQNIVTNDVYKVNDNYSCFTSLLTPQGKYLYDFMIIKHKNGYIIDCELNQIEELIKRLNTYKLNSKIEILNLSNEFQVAVVSNEKFLTLDNSKDIEGYTTTYRNDPFLVDPRNKKLGVRVIINLEKLYLSIKKLKLSLSDPKNYYELSHKLGIAQVNMKKLQEKAFGLECNFEKLNGIDFKKGCYVGQENTARMKLKNKVRKKLLPVSYSGDIPEFSDILFKENVVGKIIINGPYPFALFKTVEPKIEDFIKEDLICNNIKLKIVNDLYT